MKSTSTVLLSALTALVLLTSACTSDATYVCERRKECVASALDIDDCVTEIENFADDSAANEGKLEDCAVCLDGKSCSEAIGSCGDDCFGVPGW